MAIARLQAKVGQVGKGAAHAEYIAREGKYAARLERGEKLEATEAGNMPAWAAAEPALFWQAADRHERANGTAYREFELALPRELTPDDRAALVRDWVRQELGDRHAYQWAIHNPRAVDGGEQPHAHLMFSERQRDGIDRNPDRYFKRYNAKHPEKGGARKGYGPNAGQTLKPAERVDELKALRSRWADLVNVHLERAGLDERIDMRSYREQGIEREREGRQKPSDWHQGGKATAIEFRQMRAEQEQAAADFRQAVPVGLVSTLEDQRRRLDAIRQEIQTKAAADLAQLRVERDQNTARIEAKQAAEAAAVVQQYDARQAAWLADQPARDAAERERVARVEAATQRDLEQQRQERAARFQALRDAHAAKLAALERPPVTQDQAKPPETPTAPAVEPKAAAGRPRNVGKQDPEAVYAVQLKPIQEQAQKAAAATIEALRQERQEWTQERQAHQEVKPTIGLFGRQAKWERAGVALDQAGKDLERREGAAVKAADPQAIECAAVADLRRQAPAVVEAAEQARRQREAREQEARRLEQEKRRADYAKAQVGKDFKSMAFRREGRMFGYTDRSEKWQALPAELKEKIEAYNSFPKEKRPAELERIGREPRTVELLSQAREISRSQDRGL